MNLAERYFAEFKKQSCMNVDLEIINDNEFKIHLDDSREFYVHVSIQDEAVDVEEHVTNFLEKYEARLIKELVRF